MHTIYQCIDASHSHLPAWQKLKMTGENCLLWTVTQLGICSSKLLFPINKIFCKWLRPPRLKQVHTFKMHRECALLLDSDKWHCGRVYCDDLSSGFSPIKSFQLPGKRSKCHSQNKRVGSPSKSLQHTVFSWRIKYCVSALNPCPLWLCRTDDLEGILD